MTFPQVMATRFFQLIDNRKFTEAQRELQRIKEKTPTTKWDHGYYKALQGMLLAQKTNGNQYIFLQKINLGNKTAIEENKKEFSKRVKSRFADNFDRGFFAAWVDFTKLLINTLEESKPKPETEGQTRIIQYAETTQKGP